MADENGNAPATKADLAALRVELKGDLAAYRGETKGDLAAYRGETKEDLAAFRGEMKEDLATLRGESHSDLLLLKEQFQESIHDAETRILKAFYGYAEATQKRLALLEGTDANILGRLGSMETRLLEVEKRLNMPPSPPGA